MIFMTAQEWREASAGRLRAVLAKCDLDYSYRAGEVIPLFLEGGDLLELGTARITKAEPVGLAKTGQTLLAVWQLHFEPVTEGQDAVGKNGATGGRGT